MVGLLAEQIFGFKGAATRTGDPALDLEKANAIGNALLCFMIIPWTLCLVAYCGEIGFCQQEPSGVEIIQQAGVICHTGINAWLDPDNFESLL